MSSEEWTTVKINYHEENDGPAFLRKPWKRDTIMDIEEAVKKIGKSAVRLALAEVLARLDYDDSYEGSLVLPINTLLHFGKSKAEILALVSDAMTESDDMRTRFPNLYPRYDEPIQGERCK